MGFPRFDRFFSCFVVHPILKKIDTLCNPHVPILMYHSISDLEGRFPHPYYETRTSPRVFEEQMKFLDENGYSSIDLSEIPAAIEKDNGWCRPVVITFDDGYKDFLINAFPIIDKYGFKITVFLATGMMGSSSSTFGGKEILGWSDVRGLIKRGVTFGSHTVNHRILKKLTLEEVEAEIWGSKMEIESHIGEPVDSFSYPYAFPEGKSDFLAKYFGILDRCGYQFGVTTTVGRVGKGNNLFALKRLPVNHYDDSSLFKAKLDGAYDWVHVPQYLRKKFIGWVGK